MLHPSSRPQLEYVCVLFKVYQVSNIEMQYRPQLSYPGMCSSMPMVGYALLIHFGTICVEIMWRARTKKKMTSATQENKNAPISLNKNLVMHEQLSNAMSFCIMRVFELKELTKNSSMMLEKGQIHSGMLLVEFAVNKSQKRRTRPPYRRRGAGSQHQILNLDMVR